MSAIAPELDKLGEIAGGELYSLQLADRENEPTLVQWDAWGNRIDRIEVTPLWRRAAQIAAQAGLDRDSLRARTAATRASISSRPSICSIHRRTYTCPLAMTDGAARTLTGVEQCAADRTRSAALTSRDPARAWTSGQWMTESTGGSDVGASLTRAERDEHGHWRLYGKKWFTSAITSQMALTLARPVGNGPAAAASRCSMSRRTTRGTLNGMRVERLKDKLGTRKVPTAELLLDGARRSWWVTRATARATSNRCWS